MSTNNVNTTSLGFFKKVGVAHGALFGRGFAGCPWCKVPQSPS